MEPLNEKTSTKTPIIKKMPTQSYMKFIGPNNSESTLEGMPNRNTGDAESAHNSQSTSSENISETLGNDRKNFLRQKSANCTSPTRKSSCGDLYKEYQDSPFGQRYVLRKKVCSADCEPDAIAQMPGPSEIETNEKDTIAVDDIQNQSVGSLEIVKCKSSELLAKTSPGFVKQATKLWEEMLSGAMGQTTFNAMAQSTKQNWI